jgi:hypothetical protein
MRRAACCLTILAIAACQGGDYLGPTSGPSGSPAFRIADGAHSTGNPDFFFLPPMVGNPSHSPNWDDGAFNPRLIPTVDICEVDATTEAQVTLGALCKAGGYAVSLGTGTPADEMYSVNWGVPNSPVIFYRIKVRVGSNELGTADVETAVNSSQLKNVNANNFVPLNDGKTLPIKFRIERFALCTPAGVGPCGSATVNLAGGGIVTAQLDESTGPTGVDIPAQENTSPQSTITVQKCASFNPRITDLPTFGSCVRITADPPLPGNQLTNAATVFVCDLHVTTGGNVASHAQQDRITLHRYDATPTPTLKALPHVAGCPVQTASASWSIKGMLADLVHGRVRSAGRQVVAMLSPAPLYAAKFLDQGGGGTSGEFSDFQFVLPAMLVKTAATDSQTALPGALLALDPEVTVTDLGGEPVRGATVTFATADGSVAPLSFLTLGDGKAHAAWTLPASAGAKSLTASGRGLAGSDNNGPRAGIDPFQPIQPPFDPAVVGGEVTVLTGAVTFAATADPEPIASGYFDFGSGGFSSRGIGSLDTAPTGWPFRIFDAAANGFTIGTTAAFGSGVICGNTPATGWSPSTDLLVRKKFSLASAGSVDITIAIDNDVVEVWLNGTKLNPSTVVHEGCAYSGAGDNYVVTGAGAAGVNTLAIRVRDRGDDAYFDVRVAAGS